MTQINSEQDLVAGLSLIMGRDFETHTRTRRIRVAYMILVQFIAFLEEEIIKDELKATPKDKGGFYEAWEDYQVLLGWGYVSQERMVIDVCNKHGILIPLDPIEAEL